MGVTGVLGGAFDPPHLGHVALARGGVARTSGSSACSSAWSSDPGTRRSRRPPPVRLELARLAFAGLAGVEIELDPHARTVDSLEALALPDPVFLVGADEFADFLSWKEPERVLELARLGVGTRPGVPARAAGRGARVLARPDRVELFEIEPHDVSSSELRALAAAGRRSTGSSPAAVAERIRELGLYRAA